MKLLHIAASPKPDEQSSGKRVANAFVDAYLKKHEQVQFRYIDLHTLKENNKHYKYMILYAMNL